MATLAEVQKLAALARLRMSDEELSRLTNELDAIIHYVGQLESLELPAHVDRKPLLRNVMREDTRPHEPGAYTEKVAEQFPARKGDALSVKQIISHD